MNNNALQTASTPIATGDIVRNSSVATAMKNNTLHLSGAQREQLQRFMRTFPTEKSVIDYFAPKKWEAALANRAACLGFGMVTLNFIKLFYGESIAQQIVKNNLVGLYTVARPREILSDQALNLAAGLFVGKFGNDLSIFGALYYFASYLTTYRNSFATFDLQDVLRQCDQKFMPQWRTSIHRNERRQPENQGTEETGRAALFTYLRREYVAKGRDVRESNIYKVGALAEEDIPLVESMEPLAF